MSDRFKLYPEEQHWWSFNDYKAVLDALAKTGAKRVLEFGPGSSTLALIEGGADFVVTCEDNDDWAKVYEERLVGRFPGKVHLARYVWPEGAPLSVSWVDHQRFDLALIDGPLGTERRPEVLRYALDRCKWVLMPTEDYHVAKPHLRPRILDISADLGVSVVITETGPLSGGFALLGPTCC